MKDLVMKLGNIPNAYDDFILGVINYAKRDKKNIKKISEYIDAKDNITTSDVIKYISEQPEFKEYNNKLTEKVG